MSLTVRGNFDNRSSLYLLCYRQHKVHVHRKRRVLSILPTLGVLFVLWWEVLRILHHTVPGTKTSGLTTRRHLLCKSFKRISNNTTVHRLHVLRKHFIATPQYKFNQSGWRRPELQDWWCLSWKEKLLWWLGLAQELGQPLPSCFQNTVPPWLFLGGMRRT